ncbi:MAG: TolC family protein [Bdellovibrionales bacterium]|nr:TolC family protein [Bdellovibrionales bacterium]
MKQNRPFWFDPCRREDRAFGLVLFFSQGNKNPQGKKKLIKGPISIPIRYGLKFYVLFYICTFSTFSHALTLSQDIVVKKVLENSLEYQKIKASETKPMQNLASVEAFLDWQFFVNAGCESQERNTLNIFENPFQEKCQISSSIGKNFLTGTHLKIQYSHIQWEREFTSAFKKINNSPNTTFTQQLELIVEQDLIRNIFGYEDHIKLNIVSTQVEAHKLKLTEETEDLILQAIRQFWHTYIHHLSLKLKTSKKKDYADLAKITKEKSKYGYIKPGELNQIQAEWEQAKIEVILQKISYEDELKKLLNLLNIKHTNNTVRFNISKNPSSPPAFDKSLLQTPRRVLLMKKNLLVQKQQLKIQQSSRWPTLKLFGSYGVGGYERSLTSAFEGLTERRNQNYSIGLKFHYSLPSTRARTNLLEFNEDAVEVGEWEVEITKKEFERLIDSTRENLQALYLVLRTSEKIHKLRAGSYKEIRKAFLQGRLDVFQLISAREFTLLSEIEKARLKSRYYQALAYAYAVRDQLILVYK